MSAPRHARSWMTDRMSIARLSGYRSRRGRAFAALIAAVLGFGLVILGSSTTTSMALSTTPTSGAAQGSSCTTPVTLSHLSAHVSGSTVTVSYMIAGCVGTVRLHIHQNLTTGPNAGSDSAHQSNANFQIGANSPTSQSVPLLAGVAGKCWVQIDYSTPTERHGIFTPTSGCSTPSSSTPVTTPETTPVTTPETTPVTTPETTPVTTPETTPVTTPETTPVTSNSESGTSATNSPSSSTTTSHGIEGTTASSNGIEGTTASSSPTSAQLGPVAVTNFSGTLVPVRSQPYRWATVVGIALLLLALATGAGLVTGRRGSSS